jgi:chloramphenicol 3-O phosphotransferase
MCAEMEVVPDPGVIVVLNGAPRSGKSSIARAMQGSSDGLWLNLGVDAFCDSITPAPLLPGIGLRPGGERPDLEPQLPLLFEALYESVVALSGLGLRVVVDVGHHDEYSRPLGILGQVARRLSGLPAYFIGVRCPVETIVGRRDAVEPGREGRYLRSGPDGAVPDAVLRWQRAVHDPGVYDLEVDTSALSPEECAVAIRDRLRQGPPAAFSELGRRPTPGR